MEWMIDDFAISDILQQICSKWNVEESQADELLALAQAEWKKNERENNEQKRLRKIESLKKLKRSLKEAYRGTPAGISVLLGVEKELYKLESLGGEVISPGTSKEDKLTDKREKFCREYVVDLNATQAYKRAGFTCKTDAVAGVEGHKLLKNPKIRKFIEQLQAESRRTAQLNTDAIIEDLRDLADWNIQDFLNPDGTLRNLAEMDLKKTKAVAGIKVTEKILPDGTKQVTTELKLTDKRAALVDLGRHTGAFKEDNKQKATKIKVTRK